MNIRQHLLDLGPIDRAALITQHPVDLEEGDMNRTILAASISGIIVMTFSYPAVTASPRGTDSLLLQTQGGTIEQSAARGGRGGGHSANRSASRGSANRNVNRNVNRSAANRNVTGMPIAT
jgi:hypothetical protein